VASSTQAVPHSPPLTIRTLGLTRPCGSRPKRISKVDTNGRDTARNMLRSITRPPYASAGRAPWEFIKQLLVIESHPENQATRRCA